MEQSFLGFAKRFYKKTRGKKGGKIINKARVTHFIFRGRNVLGTRRGIGHPANLIDSTGRSSINSERAEERHIIVINLSRGREYGGNAETIQTLLKDKEVELENKEKFWH